MPRERTAEDKLLAVLALAPAPIERGVLAEQLGVSKQRVAALLLGLVQDGRVTALPGAAEGQGGRSGRPPARFWLASRALPGVLARHQWFSPHTVVLTPSNREASVVRMLAGGFAELQYLDDHSHTTLHGTLLRPFQAGRERPEPVRVTA